MKSRLTCWVHVLLLFALPLASEETFWVAEPQAGARVSLRVQEQPILLSEHLQLALIIQQPGGVIWDSAAFRTQWSEQLSAAGWRLTKEDVSLDGDSVEVRYLIRASQIGHHAIELPPVVLGAEQTVTWQVPVVPVEVRLPPADEFPDALPGSALLSLDPDVLIRISPQNREQLLDDGERSERERQRLLEEFRLRRILFWTLVLSLLGAACVYLGRRLWRVYRDKQLLAVEEPYDPRAHALEQLAALQQRDLPKQQLYEPYYTGLSSIVRVYMEKQYGLQAPEQSTEEFLASLHRAPQLPEAAKLMLKEFLREADLVKYARGASSEDACLRVYQSCLSLIEA